MRIQITGGEVEVDDGDAAIVLRHSWYVNEHGYAVSRIGGRLVRMHKLLTHTDRNQHIDHRHGNGLDNRRSEIRLASRSQNMWNSAKKNRGGERVTTSKFKGVSFDKRADRWVAEVWKFKRKIFTKQFLNEADAALAYNIVAKREFGDFAKLNDLESSSDDLVRVAGIVGAYSPRGSSRGGSVTFVKSWGKWIFRKKFDGTYRYMGSFHTREAAEEMRAQLLQPSTGGAPKL